MPEDNQLLTKSIPASINRPSFNIPKVPLLVVAFILLVLLTGVGGYLIGNVRREKTVIPISPTVQKEIISGTFDLNGYIPEGSFLGFEVKGPNDTGYQIVGSGLRPADGLTWQWGQAEKNTTYEIRGFIVNNQSRIAVSDMISVVAPAYNEVIRIVSPLSDNKPAKTTISGTIDLNGYVPTGSVIILKQRKKGDENFSSFAEVKAYDQAGWSFTEAESGSQYDLQAYLSANGTNIGQSVILSISAPANNEVLVINSNATSLPVNVSISGKIGINGSAPSGSTISVGQRISGTNQFNNVLSGIATSDGIAWSWNSAQQGSSYDLQAYLVNNGNTIAQSSILTVSAPAQNEVLNISVSSQPPQPPADAINVWCLTKGNNGRWQVKISYNNNQRIKNATTYRITLYAANSGNNLVSTDVSPANPSDTQTLTTDYVVVEGVSHFAQFAYTTCSSCSNFSAFSPSYQFNCTTTPTNTPTPAPASPTPTPTSSPSPTDTPEPTPPAPTNLPQ